MTRSNNNKLLGKTRTVGMQTVVRAFFEHWCLDWCINGEVPLLSRVDQIFDCDSARYIVEC